MVPELQALIRLPKTAMPWLFLRAVGAHDPRKLEPRVGIKVEFDVKSREEPLGATISMGCPALISRYLATRPHLRCGWGLLWVGGLRRWKNSWSLFPF